LGRPQMRKPRITTFNPCLEPFGSSPPNGSFLVYRLLDPQKSGVGVSAKT
jgi:hypothetical protein